MIEITSTRANELVDPALHVWGWEIPVYLFLGGLVAGMMLVSGAFLLRGRGRRPGSVTPWLPLASLVVLSAGMGALFLDLEAKLHVWRFYTTFRPTSPMSWGSWILLLVYPALLAQIAFAPPPALAALRPAAFAPFRRLAGRPGALRAVAVANLALGGALGVYTGILLSTLGARPLWNSALLGPLFLLSGISSAAALVHLVARDAGERETLARADNVALAAELAVVLLFVVGLSTAGAAHRAAAGLLLGGPFTAVFWGLVVGLGMVVPLAVQSLAVRHRIAHNPVAPLLVLAGGLALRVVLVVAGQASAWS